MRRSISFAAAVLVGAAPSVFAQGGGQEVFEWTGRVDREVQISMRNNQISTRDIGSNESGRGRSRVLSSLPRQDGQVSVRVINGRGDADVIQQPSAQNGYTTVVRVMDRSGGADDYRIAAYWQGLANGEYAGRSRGGIERREGAGGQSQSMLHWSGNVDGELEIRIQNGRVEYRTLSGQQPTGIRADRGNMNMRGSGNVMLSTNTGRGSVNVIQQPSSGNGYTTVIRVRDPQSGYGYYDFNLMWQ
ncbi:MAG TPA: hypothetical protein VHV78_08895 [Gemmatimonadaceae bacterium]|nr:hypothetical protein [Gemmatimonadaceae bacterium]